jgi:hypothetical protein
MALSRNRLYLFIAIACIAGYIWLYFGLSSESMHKPIEVCLVKHFINIPCPSCGTTRCILALMNGDFLEACQINPFGILVAFIMIFSPLWIITDIYSNKNTLFNFYQKAEANLRKPQFAIPLVCMVTVNWIWNITKGL